MATILASVQTTGQVGPKKLATGSSSRVHHTRLHRDRTEHRSQRARRGMRRRQCARSHRARPRPRRAFSIASPAPWPHAHRAPVGDSQRLAAWRGLMRAAGTWASRVFCSAGAPNQRVGRVDGHVGDPLEFARRRRTRVRSPLASRWTAATRYRPPAGSSARTASMLSKSKPGSSSIEPRRAGPSRPAGIRPAVAPHRQTPARAPRN